MLVVETKVPSEITENIERLKDVFEDFLYLEDASYVRLRNVNLSYQLPKSLISKVKLSSATVFLTADNLYTFTNWSGMDPETAVQSYNFV